MCIHVAESSFTAVNGVSIQGCMERGGRPLSCMTPGAPSSWAADAGWIPDKTRGELGLGDRPQETASKAYPSVGSAVGPGQVPSSLE